MGYKKKRHVGIQNKVVIPQQALVFRECYAASQVKREEQIRRSEDIENPSRQCSRAGPQSGQCEQSQNGGYEIAVCYWLRKCCR